MLLGTMDTMTTPRTDRPRSASYVYRAPLLSDPSDPDTALVQVLADRQAQHAVWLRLAESEHARLIAQARDIDAKAQDQLALPYCGVGETPPRAEIVAEYSDGAGLERSYLDRVHSGRRDQAIAAQAQEREETAAKRQADGLGYAGSQARSGASLRYAVGFEYSPDTEAGQYAPTVDAPTGNKRPADLLSRAIEREQYLSPGDIARLSRAVARLESREDCQEAIHDIRRQASLDWQASHTARQSRRSARHSERRINRIKLQASPGSK